VIQPKRATLDILIIDDDRKASAFVADFLTSQGYRVHADHSGAEGIATAARMRPKAIILDVAMPVVTGYEVCRRLKSSAVTRNIPVMMLTALGQTAEKVHGLDAGADDYLVKPVENAELVARIRALLRRTTPYPEERDRCTLTVRLDLRQPVSINATGALSIRRTSESAFSCDVNGFARLGAAGSQGTGWRAGVKVLGASVFDAVFGRHPKILEDYRRAQGRLHADRYLRLRFEHSRDLLRVPLEFMFDGGGDDNYLVLRHSVARSIVNVSTTRRALCPAIINEMWSGDELKVLLIASDTGSIPGVDVEVAMLSELLASGFTAKGVRVHVDVVDTDRASYDAVRELLRECAYHVVHYAGHGAFSADSPERSALYFWERAGRGGAVRAMLVSELQMLLGSSNARFAFLSCCSGAATASEAELVDDDFLGIADGLVQCGVPAVLGCRWAVCDRGAVALSKLFYSGLIETGSPDDALARARRELAATDRDDATWLSPLLVVQD
jgi:CheY-like chemotaxis protein